MQRQLWHSQRWLTEHLQQWLLLSELLVPISAQRDDTNNERDNERTLRKATAWLHSSFIGAGNPFCWSWLQVMMILSKEHFLVRWLRKTAIPPTDSAGNFLLLVQQFVSRSWKATSGTFSGLPMVPHFGAYVTLLTCYFFRPVAGSRQFECCCHFGVI